PSRAWLNMAKLNRFSCTSMAWKGEMEGTTTRASLEPSPQAWAIISPCSTPGVRMTTSALRPMVSSGSMNWASRTEDGAGPGDARPLDRPRADAAAADHDHGLARLDLGPVHGGPEAGRDTAAD